VVDFPGDTTWHKCWSPPGDGCKTQQRKRGMCRMLEDSSVPERVPWLHKEYRMVVCALRQTQAVRLDIDITKTLAPAFLK